MQPIFNFEKKSFLPCILRICSGGTLFCSNDDQKSTNAFLERASTSQPFVDYFIRSRLKESTLVLSIVLELESIKDDHDWAIKFIPNIRLQSVFKKCWTWSFGPLQTIVSILKRIFTFQNRKSARNTVTDYFPDLWRKNEKYESVRFRTFRIYNRF